MGTELPDTTWEALSHDILTGMREIEGTLDERLTRLRARMLQDMALQSVAADWKEVPAAERPVCAVCSTPLMVRGNACVTSKRWGRRS